MFPPVHFEMPFDLVFRRLGNLDILHHLTHLVFKIFLDSILPPDLAIHGSISESLFKVPETVLCDSLIG